MAGLVLEDMYGTGGGSGVSGGLTNGCTEKVKLEVPVLVKAAVRVEEDAAPKLFINEITPLDEAKVKLPRSCGSRFGSEAQPDGDGGCAAWPLYPEPGRDAQVLFDLVRAGEFARGNGS